MSCQRVLGRDPVQSEAIQGIEEDHGAFSTVRRVKISDPELKGGLELQAIRKEVEATPSQLLSEAEAMKRVSNVEVFAVHSLSRSAGGPRGVIYQQFVPGQDLETQLGQGDWDSALGLWITLLLWLQRAAQRGVVHRDLKPQNVRIFRPPRSLPQFRVIDFNLACSLDQFDRQVTRCRQEGVAGSQSHLSPWMMRVLGGVNAEDREFLEDLLDEFSASCPAGTSMDSPQAPLQQLFLRNDLWAAALTVFQFIMGLGAFRGAFPSEVSEDLRRLRHDHFTSPATLAQRMTDRLIHKHLHPASWTQARLLSESLAKALDPQDHCVTATQLSDHLASAIGQSGDLPMARVMDAYLQEFQNSFPVYCEEFDTPELSRDTWDSSEGLFGIAARQHPPESEFQSFEQLLFEGPP